MTCAKGTTIRMAGRAATWLGVAFLGSAAGGCIPGVDLDGDDGDGFGTVSSDPIARRPGGPTSSVLRAAITAEKAPAPLSGGTLRVLGDGRTAVVSDPERDRIFVADLGKLAVLASIELRPGDEPGRVTEDAAGRVHVALRRGGAIVTLDPKSWAIASRREICGAPRGVAYEPDKDLLHVACVGGELVSLPPAPEAEPVRTLHLDRDLRDVVVSGNRMFVSRFRAAEVLVLDEAGKLEGRWKPALSTTFVNRDKSSTRETVSPAVAWELVAGKSPGEVYMVHQRGLDGEVSIDQGGYGGGNCGGIFASVVSRVGTTFPSPTLSTVVLPADLALAPDGKKLAVLSAGSALTGAPQVFLSSTDQMMTGGDCVAVGSDGGRGPIAGASGSRTGGVAPTDARPRDGGTDAGDEGLPEVLEAVRQPTGEAIALAFTPGGHLVVQTREPAALQIVTAGNRTITLSYDSRADSGYALFHANSGAGLACASCHPEGGDDGRVWTFAKIGARRTQSLRGGIMGTAPFHWNGDMKSMDHLMKEVFEHRMSGPTMEKPFVEALGKWIDRIPAISHGKPVDPGAVARGKALFESPAVGCARCHGGAMLTNNTSANVGTGRALQVPSLKGIMFRGPFMHNGCATTLGDRFRKDCGGDDRHGITSRLTPAQREDLVKFMETL